MSVTLDHVTRTVDGVHTIRDVSLTLEKGTLSVLLGPTLSGKTSIMRLLAGLDKPTTGRVLVDGKDVTGFDVRQRSVAMVYQQFINYPSLTVSENIASPLRVQGKPRAEIEKRVAEAARLLRLEPFLKRTPLQLSGGQQQRTAMARALVKGADLVLLGPTLSGKTSIMRLLAGLDKPTTGKLLVNGKDVTGVDVRQRSVAMVYQQFINYPSLTVYENIASPLRVQGKPRKEIETRVAEAARLLRLEPFLKRTPLQLSGGQQQRTAMARALVKGADLVLLDEPLANLDYKLREELRTELPRIFEASGAIFVYATTEPTEALLLGGNTVCMWEGRALQIGETPSVYRRPQTLRVAQVFSDPPLNLVGIEKKNGSVQYAGGIAAPASGLYSSLADGAYRVGFRAHQLALANGETDRHAFHATVTVTEITGSESFVHLTRDGSNWVAVLHGVHEFEPGQTLDAVLDPNDVFVFDAADRLVAAPGS